MEYVHGVEIAHDGHLNAGHGRNQNARMLKVAYGPTITIVSQFQHPCRFGGYAYFNLQHIVTSKPLVVHLMICIVGITTALIFHKCESQDLSMKIRIQQAWKLTVDSRHYEVLGYRSALSGRNFKPQSQNLTVDAQVTDGRRKYMEGGCTRGTFFGARRRYLERYGKEGGRRSKER